MGPVPVLLACQRPRHLDADGIALLALRQVVADDQEEERDGQWDDALDLDGDGEGDEEGRPIGQHADRCEDPAREDKDPAPGIALRVGEQGELHHQVDERQEEGEAEDGHGTTGPSIRDPVGVEVDGDLLGESIIEDQGGYDGQEGDDGGPECRPVKDSLLHLRLR